MNKHKKCKHLIGQLEPLFWWGKHWKRDVNAHDQAMLSWKNKYIMENFLIYNWMNKCPFI